LYGAFVWARRALNRPFRRFLARADDERDAAIDASCKNIDDSLSGMPVVVPAGSAIIMAYDLYHRGCR
jgi:hypothetical protein